MSIIAYVRFKTQITEIGWLIEIIPSRLASGVRAQICKKIVANIARKR